MAALILPSRWTRQPAYPAILDVRHPLTTNAQLVSCGVFDNLGGTGKFSTYTGTPAIYADAPGVGRGYSSTVSRSTATDAQYAGTSPWTIAIVATLKGANKGTFCGTANGLGNGTYDRQLLSNVNGFYYGAYLYDGAAKNASTGIAPASGDQIILVGTTNGSTLDVYLAYYNQRAVTKASVAVSNAGYNGYATPQFIVGNSSPSPIANDVSYELIYRSAAYWPESAAREFVGNPWQLFQPLNRRRYFGAAAGATARTAVTSLTAAVQAARSATASLSAAVRAPQLAMAAINAAVAQPRTAASVIDAAVRAARSATANVDAAVQAARSASANVDAAVRAPRTAGASLDSAVALARSATAAVDAAVRAAATAGASLNAAVRDARSATASLNAYVLGGTLLTANLDAAVQAALAATASLSAAIQQPRSAAAALDALVIAGGLLTAQLDAAVQQARSAQVSLSAAIALSRTAAASIDARVVNRGLATADLGAAVLASYAAFALVDAVVIDLAAITGTGRARIGRDAVVAAAGRAGGAVLNDAPAGIGNPLRAVKRRIGPEKP